MMPEQVLTQALDHDIYVVYMQSTQCQPFFQADHTLVNEDLLSDLTAMVCGAACFNHLRAPTSCFEHGSVPTLLWCCLLLLLQSIGIVFPNYKTFSSK